MPLDPSAPLAASTASTKSLGQRALDLIEWAGNKLPDPALLFVWGLLITWGLSWALSSVAFTEFDPRTTVAAAPGKPPVEPQPIRVINQLSGTAIVANLSSMVKIFIEFPPLGVVLVALLGVGVAEHTGFIAAVMKGLLRLTPNAWLTPMVLFVSIISHSAGDTGYVLIIPLGGVLFAAAGRHPVAGIVCAFAGVSGGFSANFLPSSLDPLLQGFTQSAAQIVDPSYQVNPLCNWYFTSVSSVLILVLGWWVTDVIIEPRLARTPVDDAAAAPPDWQPLTRRETAGVGAGLGMLWLVCAGLAVWALWPNSAWRSANGSLTAHDAPLMQAIVPLIFVLFLAPAIVYGVVAGTVRSHRDIVAGMTKSMGSMSYYLVLAFFAAQFTNAFKVSNLGVLLAVKGADGLQALGLPAQVTIVGIILLSGAIDLVVGSASAKWAILGPIFVPMLMEVGISPELTQAAYRVGDSCTNIVTPLMPYFPLVVVYCQKYLQKTGIGTLISLMLPYALLFIVSWIGLLLLFWGAGIPLGLDASYTYSR